MKVEIYAANAKVGEVIYATPKGRRTAVKMTVIRVECTREWVFITGTRIVRGEPVTVECELLAFAPVKLEL